MAQMIENEAAYENAIKRNIVNNARTTWFKNTERADEINDWLCANQFKSDFAESLFKSLHQDWGKLSEKQCEAVLKCIDGQAERQAKWDAKQKAEHAAAESIENGKQQITGEILSIKTRDGFYGLEIKMIVKDDRGFKVWGTVPSKLLNAADEAREFNGKHYLDWLKGKRVSFSANLEASEDDIKFGFYKRPTKVSLTEPA